MPHRRRHQSHLPFLTSSNTICFHFLPLWHLYYTDLPSVLRRSPATTTTTRTIILLFVYWSSFVSYVRNQPPICAKTKRVEILGALSPKKLTVRSVSFPPSELWQAAALFVVVPFVGLLHNPNHPQYKSDSCQQKTRWEAFWGAFALQPSSRQSVVTLLYLAHIVFLSLWRCSSRTLLFYSVASAFRIFLPIRLSWATQLCPDRCSNRLRVILVPPKVKVCIFFFTFTKIYFCSVWKLDLVNFSNGFSATGSWDSVPRTS